MALLRALGFADIHFLHGGYEFGKDFIAKREEDGTRYQYVFQSKAGGFNLGAWNRIKGQLDSLRRSRLAHPSFDSDIPRKAVLVMTGRLVGAAGPDAQEYAREARDRNETPLEIWDRERLVESMTGAIGVGLTGRIEGQFLRLVGSIDSREVTDQDIERVSRSWYASGQDAWPCALEAAVIAERLRGTGRLDLACYVSLALVRAACRHAHGQVPIPAEWESLSDLGRAMFRTYAESLWERRLDGPMADPGHMIRAHAEAAALVTYAVRCVRLLELMALLGLLNGEAERPTAKEIGRWILEFLANQRGATYLISDRWAVAAIPPVLLLAREGHRPAIVDYLQRLIAWVGDRYSGGIGLAGPTANSVDEVAQVIGNLLPPASRPPRRESQIATVVLDLLAFLGMPAVYRQARNDFRAVEALPSVLITRDTPDQYLIEGAGLSVEPNMPYADELSGDWSDVAPHLTELSRPRYLQHVGRSWDHLAVIALLRDRHFVCSWPDSVLRTERSD